MPAIQEYWPLVLETLKKSVSTSSYKAWFTNLDLVSTASHGKKIILQVPSTFNKDYLEKKFKNEISEAIAKYYPKVIHIEYKIDTKKSINIEKTLIQEEIIAVEKINKEELAEAKSLQHISDFLPKKNLNNLNPKYSLETFVVNASNELAVSVAKSIIREPGKHYNPVFIYSGTGMGKTHLLQAIGQKMLEERPGFKIKYATLETFFNHFIASVQKNKGGEFRDYYRSVDLLLIDDIQFIRGKDATQEAFFHTFNELHQQNKQIVIASDRPPKFLEGVEDRLVSRFEWGMVVDINKPTLEDRMAILKYKLEKSKIQLSPEHILMIAQKVDTNIRDIEGVLNRIQARIDLLPNREITLEDVQKLLFGYKYSSVVNIDIQIAPVNSEQIVSAVSKVFNLTKEDIMGNSREKNIALARQVSMWLCKTELDLSFPTIGRLFGGKDHTTVMHAYNKIEKLKQDGKLSQKLDLLAQILKIHTPVV